MGDGEEQKGRSNMIILKDKKRERQKQCKKVWKESKRPNKKCIGSQTQLTEFVKSVIKIWKCAIIIVQNRNDESPQKVFFQLSKCICSIQSADSAVVLVDSSDCLSEVRQ